ncbi:dynamin family protein [Paenibacillus lactis]|uniref:dynamin family protein n=1 Tax=Paenibacillus lactis TaxID=228574 RepID=UPI00368DFCC8
MNIHSLLDEGSALIRKSPISMHKESGKALPVQALNAELGEFNEDLAVIARKLINPLKLVVMGEVKAGKSTLINTLAGTAVSPVKVEEATASIIVIQHSDRSEGVIVWQDGTCKEGTPSEIYTILEEHHGDLDFFSQCQYIRLSFPLPKLQRLHIVDTPGLGTITDQNNEVTLRYMQEADVILWVLNGNHMGQADIEESIASAARMGKPILVVVNRIDEVDGDPESIRQYVLDQLSIYTDQVFAVSAYEAFEAMRRGDEARLSRSGYPDLLEHLERKIEEKADIVHLDSIYSSIEALLRKNLFFHESCARSLQFLKSQTRDYERDLDYHNGRIKQELEDRLRQWGEVDFLRKEKQEIIHMIENLKIFSGKQEKDEIDQKLRRNFSEEKISLELNKITRELGEQMRDAWMHSLKQIQDKQSLQLQSFIRNEQVQLDVSLLDSLSTGQEMAVDGAKKGAVIAGAWGTAAAAYTAWLGPYASSITLGAAAGAILPPLLIAGAVTGAVAKLVSFRQQKNRFKNDLDVAFTQAKQEIMHRVIPGLISSLRKHNDKYAEQMYTKYVELTSNGNSPLDIERLEQSINRYIEENKMMLNQMVAGAGNGVS